MSFHVHIKSETHLVKDGALYAMNVLGRAMASVIRAPGLAPPTRVHDLQPVVDLEFRLVVRQIIKWTSAPNEMWQTDFTYLKIIALSIIARQ